MHIYICVQTRTHFWEFVTAKDRPRSNSRVRLHRWLRLRLIIHDFPSKPWCVTWLIYIWHDSYICDMTHIRVLSYIYVTWLRLIILDSPSKPWYVIWLIYMWHVSYIYDMTHRYVTWLSLRLPDFPSKSWYVTWLTHLYVTWLIYTWHDSYTCGMTQTAATRVSEQVTVSFMHTRDSYICDMTCVNVTWLGHGTSCA